MTIRDLIESAAPEYAALQAQRPVPAMPNPLTIENINRILREAMEDEILIPGDPQKCAEHYEREGIEVGRLFAGQDAQGLYVVDLLYYRDLDLEYMRLERRVAELTAELERIRQNKL